MNKPALSICLDDLGLEAKAAMDAARRLGFRAIDVGATAGPISPQELSATGRRHLLKHLSDLGIRLGSLRGPVGPQGFADPIAGERRIETASRIIELASGLRVPTVSMTIGTVMMNDEGRVREALTVLADRADRCGVVLAIETAGIGARELGSILAEINCPQLAACCDSGAMIMRGDDPHRLAESLPGRIRLARARDAVPGSMDCVGSEVMMGQGSLDPPRFLASLVEAGFAGDIVLARTGSAKPAEELRHARELFERYL